MFDYDPEGWMRNNNLKTQLELELNTLNIKIMKECKAFFGEIYQALMHLKIMKIFIDGVLRFGIPPKFFLGIVKPDRNQDAKIMKNLLNTFAEDHLRDMYGDKTDA